MEVVVPTGAARRGVAQRCCAGKFAGIQVAQVTVTSYGNYSELGKF